MDGQSQFLLNDLCLSWQEIFRSKLSIKMLSFVNLFKNYLPADFNNLDKEIPSQASLDVVAQLYRFTVEIFPKFIKALESKGWVTLRNHLGPNEWRSDWTAHGS